MAVQCKPLPTAVPTKSAIASEPTDVQICKRGSCPTLSGKSTLRYEFALDPTKAFIVRVTGCSGGGFFSNEWVSLSGIRSALQKASPFTAILLFPLFHGKSVNTPGYLLAVLRAEKLIQALPGKNRVHELCPDWDARVASIVQGGSDTDKSSTSKPKPASKPLSASKAKPASTKPSPTSRNKPTR